MVKLRYRVSYRATYFDELVIYADNMERARMFAEETLSDSQASDFEITSAVCIDGPEPINRKDLIHKSESVRSAKLESAKR